MDWTGIVQAVVNFGFPACMCVLLIMYMTKKDDKTETAINELKQSVDNNTLVMTKLAERIGAMYADRD